jgi:tryptophan-rich sensory protein
MIYIKAKMMSSFGIVMLFITAAIVINAVSYYFGVWKGSGGAQSGSLTFWKLYQNKLIPPGFVIGIVWVFIFGMMGYCFYKLVDKNSTTEPDGTKNAGNLSLGCIAILIYGAFALFYPLFTYGTREKNANVVNYIAIIGALVLGIIVIEEDVGSFYFLLPLLLWVSYIGLTDSLMYRNMMIRSEKVQK